MASMVQWWRRATAAIKDQRSIYLALVPGSRAGNRNPDMEVAVIRATNHDERSIDYKNAARVFTWARTSPSFLSPLMWALARRATRTHSWPVALKSLLLVHGLLLLSPPPSSVSRSSRGRLPFDLSDFCDRSPNSWGFSAFVRAYFQFLDHRSLLLYLQDNDDNDDCGLERIEKLQTLLDLLMQIKPYADGMETGLILEAMDCIVIEIFDVYSGICTGIAMFLVNVLGSNELPKAKAKEEWRRKGLKGIGVLRKAADQSAKLSHYFDMCRSLGVLNATELPPVEGIPEEDILDLEKLVVGGIPAHVETVEEEDEWEPKEEKNWIVKLDEKEKNSGLKSDTIVTKDWVVFEDELNGARQEYFEKWHGNPFVCSDRPWASMVYSIGSHSQWNGNLIELL